mmetsp:Transcript_4827/g.17060  ORF Transcript_4827/g.17060 Transcript_4827/m.17060 type:complete len:270 (-) Transcript_4827:296-1105(-)
MCQRYGGGDELGVPQLVPSDLPSFHAEYLQQSRTLPRWQMSWQGLGSGVRGVHAGQHPGGDWHDVVWFRLHPRCARQHGAGMGDPRPQRQRHLLPSPFEVCSGRVQRQHRQLLIGCRLVCSFCCDVHEHQGPPDVLQDALCRAGHGDHVEVCAERVHDARCPPAGRHQCVRPGHLGDGIRQLLLDPDQGRPGRWLFGRACCCAADEARHVGAGQHQLWLCDGPSERHIDAHSPARHRGRPYNFTDGIPTAVQLLHVARQLRWCCTSRGG